MASRPKLIAGNWKMYTNPNSAKALATALAAEVSASQTTQVAVFPPTIWLTKVVEFLKDTPIAVGAQNCHFETEGAYTGETSPTMIRECGATMTLVGHSERRHGLHESNEFLNKKCLAALSAGLKVIFCIGETLEQRRGDKTESVLDEQLSMGLKGVPAESLANLVLAYEPVWAIGTGVVATTKQAQDAHAFVRQQFSKMFGEDSARSLLIQYGGSVKPDNAEALLHQPDIDGALVGGASLKAESFLAIVKAAN